MPDLNLAPGNRGNQRAGYNTESMKGSMEDEEASRPAIPPQEATFGRPAPLGTPPGLPATVEEPLPLPVAADATMTSMAEEIAEFAPPSQFPSSEAVLSPHGRHAVADDQLVDEIARASTQMVAEAGHLSFGPIGATEDIVPATNQPDTPATVDQDWSRDTTHQSTRDLGRELAEAAAQNVDTQPISPVVSAADGPEVPTSERVSPDRTDGRQPHSPQFATALSELVATESAAAPPPEAPPAVVAAATKGSAAAGPPSTRSLVAPSASADGSESVARELKPTSLPFATSDRIADVGRSPSAPVLERPLLNAIWRWAKSIAYYSVLAATGWLMVVLGLIVLYRTVDPPFSNLMLFNRISGDVVVQKWLPIEQVPAQLIRAIVVSEDGRFCSHRGIDFKEIEDAIERAKDGTPRGASTISMQVTKNLFLWPAKSYIRKAIELPLTLVIEALWTKRRIFEVYVNIAEWGPGVFGAEAAAGYHFGKSASRVSEREAALLAVALPNPVTRDAGDPGPGTERLANTIQARMRALSRAASCVERKPRVPAT